jgi:hypothetical protein
MVQKLPHSRTSIKDGSQTLVMVRGLPHLLIKISAGYLSIVIFFTFQMVNRSHEPILRV